MNTNTTDIRVVAVATRGQMNDFITLPRRLYKAYEQYVPDMESDVRDSFNPKKNRSLAFAEAQAFVAYRGNKAVGRVAAVISKKANTRWSKRAVRFTYLEFEDDDAVSSALLDTVEQWGRDRGMVTAEGPMGITDFDKEGMLVDDFHLHGTFMELWNPAYYADHLRRRGYEKAADWLQIRFPLPKEVPARYARVAKLTKEMFGLRVVKPVRKEVYGEYGQKMFELINAAYAPLFGFSPFSPQQAKNVLARFVPLLDMEMVPCIENEKGELVGMAVTMQDLSPALRKSGGRLFPFGWWHLLKALKFNNSDKAQLMIIAVRPDMQGLGLNALFFDDLIPIYNRRGIKWCETNPQLENNVKELTQWKPLNPETVKRRRCWQKTINK